MLNTGINLLNGLLLNPLFWPVLIGLVLLTSVLASLYPVVFLSRVRPVEALRSGKIKSGNQLLTQMLVGVQFAAASALLILVIVVGQQNQFMRDIVLKGEKDFGAFRKNSQWLGGVKNTDYRWDGKTLIPQS